MTKSPRVVRTLALLVVAATLAACGSSRKTSEPAASLAATDTSTAAADGIPECTEAVLQDATSGALDGSFGMLGDGTTLAAGATLVMFSGGQCQDGWAIAGANVSLAGGPATAALFLFRAEGPQWLPVAVGEACATETLPERVKAAGCQFVRS